MRPASHQALVKELARHRSNELLQKCVAAIEDLTQELERQTRINEEQKQLIRIIQEGKEYYESECRNNPYEQQCHRLTAENAQLGHALQAQRSANQQLQERVLELQEKLKAKGREAEQLREESREYAQCLESMRLEKELLEKEWNRAVKAVKRKIEKIVAQDNPETKALTITQKHELSLDPKQPYASQDGQRRAQLQARAHLLLQSLQKMQAIEQLQNIFQHQSSRKKQSPQLSHSQRERHALRELFDN